MNLSDQLRSFKLFDAHFHIIDPRFPLVANQGYMPDEFSCDQYLARTKNYNLAGGAIVSGSFQAFDQGYLRHALKRLGPSFVGVTQVPATISDQEILELHSVGVRALRFNVKRGGSESVGHLDRLARRVHELAGWHVELYLDPKDLAELYPTLVALPAVSIDHMGLSRKAYDVLLRLVERGVHVKASGFGRLDFDVKTALQEICAANPGSLMFGTDLPSTRAPRPYQDEDILLVIDTLGEEKASKVLCENALAFYRPTVAPI